MCTSITLQTADCYFGRTLDLTCSFGERVVITPRNYGFRFLRQRPLDHHYAMIGMASVWNNYPLYAEAVNEKGLYMAGLNFPGNACYPESSQPGKTDVSPPELIPWILGQCETAAQAKELLGRVNPIGIPIAEELPLSPLHWHVADADGSFVAEPLEGGMRIYDNPVGVLTNNPTFEFHLTNLNRYMHLTPHAPENRFATQLNLNQFGEGMGGIGLPGDSSSTSRFVKAAFHKLNSVCGDGEQASVSQFFHVLDAVSMVRGSVVTKGGEQDITTYACCINGRTGVYYYKTYENSQITAVGLFREKLDGGELREFPLVTEQRIRFEN